MAYIAPSSWSLSQVEAWASSVKLSSGTVETLLENDVDGATLMSLTKEELRTELGIQSLAVRRYLWDLIEQVRLEDQNADFSVALAVHSDEIKGLKDFKEEGPDNSAGGITVDEAVVTELQSDAEKQRQILEDRLLCFKIQNSFAAGQQAIEDSEVAREYQRQFDNLQIQCEYDHRFAASLDPGQRQIQTNPTQVKSLFGMCIDTCLRNQINVSAALINRNIQPIPQRFAGYNASTKFETDDESTVVHQNYKPSGTKRQKKAAVVSLQTLPTVVCNVCYEEGKKGFMLACDHEYCVQCMRKHAKEAFRDITLLPLRCCDLPIDSTVLSVLLPENEAEILKDRILELEIQKKMNCPTCGLLLNLDAFKDSDVYEFSCDCGTNICSSCRTLAHSGYTCEENIAMRTGSDEPLFKLAKHRGWKQCPKCSIMIEFTIGCNQMICKNCKHVFCYTCLADWGKCQFGNVDDDKVKTTCISATARTNCNCMITDNPYMVIMFVILSLV
jgi:hypothetical protein